MRAYKGFNENLACTCGKGIFYYQPGATYREKDSKTASTGFHSAENPADCFTWYSPNGSNRFFLVEAGGSIDEGIDDTKIASTELTLVKELNLKQMTLACMIYMAKHPTRKWKCFGSHHKIDEQAEVALGIAIGRGEKPKAKAKSGCIGLMLERNGVVMQAKAAMVDGKNIKSNKWYTITEEGTLVCE